MNLLKLTLLVALLACSPRVRPEGSWPERTSGLLAHLLADVDSAAFPGEGAAPYAMTSFEPRPLRINDRRPPTVGESPLAAIADDSLAERVRTILAMRRDTVSLARWARCPSILMPDVSRADCPQSPVVVFAFSDTFTLGPGSLGAAATPQLAVAVQRTTLLPSGKRISDGYYSVAHSPSGWRTLRRVGVGTVE